MKIIKINKTIFTFTKKGRTILLSKEKDTKPSLAIIHNKHDEYLFSSLSYSKDGTRHFHYLNSLDDDLIGLTDTRISYHYELAEKKHKEALKL